MSGRNNNESKKNERNEYHPSLNVTSSFEKHVKWEEKRGNLLSRGEKEGFDSNLIVSEQGYSNELHVTGEARKDGREGSSLHVTKKYNDGTKDRKARTGLSNPNLQDWAEGNNINRERIQWVDNLRQVGIAYNVEEGEGGLKKNDRNNYEQKVKNWERRVQQQHSSRKEEKNNNDDNKYEACQEQPPKSGSNWVNLL